jgi:hypothetical protein
VIPVDRSRIGKPKFFDSPEFNDFVTDLENFHEKGGTRETQHWFPWRERLEPFEREALDTLFEVFNGKCAYTEQALGESFPGKLVLHRPPGDAIGLDGIPSPVHYWWLIHKWSNWYLASDMVASVKTTQFPVLGDRAPVHEGGSNEQSLLLDPCSRDPKHHPAWHLAFWRSGWVGAWDLANSHDYPSKRLPQRSELQGVTTIQILDLNNTRLVESRRKVATPARRALMRALKSEPDAQLIEELFSNTLEYAAAHRQAYALHVLSLLEEKSIDRSTKALNMDTLTEVIGKLGPELAAPIICQPGKRVFSEHGKEMLRPLAHLVEETFPRTGFQYQYLENLLREPPIRGDVITKQTESERAKQKVPKTEFQVERPLIHTSAQIKSVTIRNFKAIHSLTLSVSELDLADLEDLRKPEVDSLRNRRYSVDLEPEYGARDQRTIESARRWWSLLGENGSGKSSILQAISLALAGDYIDKLVKEKKLEWKRFLRRPSVNEGKKISQGRICLEFRGGTRIDLRFNGNKHWWVPDTRGGRSHEPGIEFKREGKPEVEVFVRAYGATRLLEKKSNEDRSGHIRIGNLFDPRVTVLNAEEWLLDITRQDFNVAAPTIDSLLHADGLDLPPTIGIEDGRPLLTRDQSQREVLIDGVPLDLVSDGYRAVVALACDIMAGLIEGFGSIENAPGIVLIDEIGAHLHPGWRMSITRKLRRALPQVQFIVSTHEPLCLRGLFGREVIRVEKHPVFGVMVDVIERNPSQLRVDQLLTSEFFGMDTTIDPDLERRFQHYYRLLALEERDDQQEATLQKLHRYLQKNARPALGNTRRDQLVYEILDAYLSDRYQKIETGLSREEYMENRKNKRRETLKKVQDIWDRRKSAAGTGTVQ